MATMQAAKRPRHLSAAEAQQEHQEAQRREKLTEQLYNTNQHNKLADEWDDDRMCETDDECELWHHKCHPYR